MAKIKQAFLAALSIRRRDINYHWYYYNHI